MNKIWFPLQRGIRTAVQVIVASAAILATVVVVAPQILVAVQDVLPGPAVAWITGAIAALAAVSAAISRVMAIPGVDEWLKKFGAGSAPAGAVSYTSVDGEQVGMTRKQWRAYIDGADTGEKRLAGINGAAQDQAVAEFIDTAEGRHRHIPRGLPGQDRSVITFTPPTGLPGSSRDQEPPQSPADEQPE